MNTLSQLELMIWAFNKIEIKAYDDTGDIKITVSHKKGDITVYGITLEEVVARLWVEVSESLIEKIRK